MAQYTEGGTQGVVEMRRAKGVVGLARRFAGEQREKELRRHEGTDQAEVEQEAEGSGHPPGHTLAWGEGMCVGGCLAFTRVPGGHLRSWLHRCR